MRRAGGLAVLAALALSGCGSSSLSSTQLRGDATRICTATTQLTDRIPTPTSPGGATSFLTRGETAIAAEVKALTRLHPPSNLAAVYATAVGASDAELRSLRTTVRQLGRGSDPATAIKSLQRRLAPLEARANAAWQNLGISACVNR
jgi:hypothetical protein